MKRFLRGTSLIEVLLALFVTSLALTFSTYLFSYIHNERVVQLRDNEILFLAESFARQFEQLTHEEKTALAQNPEQYNDYVNVTLPEYASFSLSVIEGEEGGYLLLSGYRHIPDGKSKVVEVPFYVE